MNGIVLKWSKINVGNIILIEMSQGMTVGLFECIFHTLYFTQTLHFCNLRLMLYHTPEALVWTIISNEAVVRNTNHKRGDANYNEQLFITNATL